MSAKPMKKGLKVFLIVFIVIVLLGICFGSLALYAKHEFEKEKFWLPYVPPIRSVSELPETADEAVAYVNRLYAEASVSDEAEGSWETDARPAVDDMSDSFKAVAGDLTTSFSEKDQAVVGFIRDHAGEALEKLYPKEENVNMAQAQNAPALSLDGANILDFTAEQGRYDDDGNYVDDRYYFIRFTVDPASVDAEALKNGDVFRALCDELSPALTAQDVLIGVQSVETSVKIDRFYDKLVSAETTRSYRIDADVRLTDAYAALQPDSAGQTAKIALPYQSVEKISFKWYGARFTQGDMAVTHDDIETLPVEISVNEDAEKGKDFNLTFTYSVPDLMEVDDEVVLHVHGRHDKDDPITVGMRLEYNGHVYTDEINVYITDLEMVKTGVQFPFKEVEVAVGTSVHLITDLRVPEETKEEDYTLTYETSAPDEVSVDEHGMITVHKAVSDPVTVKVTLECSGHTYSDEMIVHITAETEGTTNG